jgi:signal transduction histidine kinase
LFKKGITRRWIFNGLGIILIVLVAIIISFSFAVQSYIYNGIQQVLVGRSDEVLNLFSTSSGYKTASEFSSVVRAYIENFQDKKSMEIMGISKGGTIIITSTGFAPDQDQVMPDYQTALSSSSNYGYWTGKLDTGEKIMAVTRVVRNSSGTVMGSIRYLVSLEKADRQIRLIVTWMVVIGAFIIFLVILSGVYFISSIVNPIRKITATATQIAKGDFDVRIEKKNDDEIGQLIDTINDMAEELGTSEKMKNDFISSVSHELRTPLTAIKGWAETIENGATDKDTFQKGMHVIIKESERLSGIVEELLDFSRIQNGRLTLVINKTDVLTVLDEAVYMFTDRARSENKELIYEEGTVLSPILGDADRLKQVFVNIIDNALKYTPSNGTITVSTSEEKGYIYIHINDTGCGIPASDLPNIKKKFYKGNQLVRGSGIGLAVADEIIALHSGKLDIASEVGKGTQVTVSIPTEKYLSENPELVQEIKNYAASNAVKVISESDSHGRKSNERKSV